MWNTVRGALQHGRQWREEACELRIRPIAFPPPWEETCSIPASARTVDRACPLPKVVQLLVVGSKLVQLNERRGADLDWLLWRCCSPGGEGVSQAVGGGCVCHRRPQDAQLGNSLCKSIDERLGGTSCPNRLVFYPAWWLVFATTFYLRRLRIIDSDPVYYYHLT